VYVCPEWVYTVCCAFPELNCCCYCDFSDPTRLLSRIFSEVQSKPRCSSTLTDWPWKSLHRNSLLYCISMHHHHGYTVGNFGKQWHWVGVWIYIYRLFTSCETLGRITNSNTDLSCWLDWRYCWGRTGKGWRLPLDIVQCLPRWNAVLTAVVALCINNHYTDCERA